MSGFSPQTRLRMLRSGRGNGYRAALDAAARDDVISCVLDDPRWDRQVESREEYYATLLIELDADVQPIVEAVSSSSDPTDESVAWLPVGVLVQMARRGHAAASLGLARCVRQGQSFRTCLDALDAAGGEALVRSVVEAKDIEHLLLVVGAEELADAARVVRAPWEAWARMLPALRFITAARRSRTTDPKHLSGPVGWMAHRLRVPDATDLSRCTVEELFRAVHAPGPIRPIVDALLRRDDPVTAQVLRRAARGDNPRERAVALQVLGKRGDAGYLDDARQFLVAQTQDCRGAEAALLRSSYVRYLQALAPELSLPLAREWLFAPWPLSHAAEEIFSERATPADRDALEEAGNAALAAGEMYRLCAMIDALSVIGAVDSLPFLCKAYADAPYSFARRRAVSALRPHASHEAIQELMVESLWDCEDESRELACAAVSRESLAVARRLKELSEDEYEDPDVRSAAAKLGSPLGG